MSFGDDTLDPANAKSRDLERLVEVIGKFWLIPRDEFTLAHVQSNYLGPEQGVVTTYISFVRKDGR